MTDIGLFYPRLVKEFIVNLLKGFNDASSVEFRKVHVHGRSFGFSPTTINEHMGIGGLISADLASSMKTIAQEITGNIYDELPNHNIQFYYEVCRSLKNRGC